MPYLFDENKLNYSGNKVAIRNLVQVCNSYEEIYSNVRAQLTLAIDSVQSWYATWNGAFLSSDVSLNGSDAEHQQFLKQLSIILDILYKSLDSIVMASSVPVSMETVSQRYVADEAIITRDVDGTGGTDTSLNSAIVWDTTFNGNPYRQLKLKYMVGRLNNIGVAFNENLPYDYVSDISSTSNRYINGRYSYRIGDFSPEILEVDLYSKTVGEVWENAANADSKGTVDFGTAGSFINVMRSLSRLKDQLNFSSGLLEDSRNLFNAAL
jgi:hypothetical protein